MAYATDSDLIKYCHDAASDNFGTGFSDLSTWHTEATAIIDRSIDVRWYREAAYEKGVDWRETAFDSSKLLNSATQLTRAAAYLTIALLFDAVRDGRDLDAKGAQADHFRTLYDNELAAVLDNGLDYDWDADATIDDVEKGVRNYGRRIVRT